MSNLALNYDSQAPETSSFREFLRPIFAVLVGLLGGYFLADSFRTGAGSGFSIESPDSVWGPHMFFWGSHYVMRGFASIISVGWGAFLGGVVARRNGAIVAVLANLPATLLWGTAGIFGILGRRMDSFDISLSNTMLAWILFAIIPVISFKFGSLGALQGIEYADHFDSRPRSLFGIKWGHYFWIAPLVTAIANQTTWAFIYMIQILGFNLVSTILYGILFSSIILTVTGLTQAYRVLSGLDVVDGGMGRAVLRYAIGYPVLAMIIQTGVWGLHYGFSKLMT